jgi:hypothetical protein
LKTLISNEEIKDIVAKLKGLRLPEKVLLQRLGRLIDSHTSELREFVIGDLVRIKNPKPLQARSGAIVKIGNRITVQA